MLLRALVLACSACLVLARMDSEEIIQDLSSFSEESSELSLQVGEINHLAGSQDEKGNYYDDSEDDLKLRGRHCPTIRPKPCPTTRCIRPTSTCCRRTTTDKVTTYILRRTTTTSIVTSSTTRSLTFVSTSLTTSSTTFTTVSTFTKPTTIISLITISRTTTLPNTTFTVSRTTTTSLPNKTVISIVTQQIMPCFTEFETCFYNCPYYEIDPNCGCMCKPTGSPEPVYDYSSSEQHRPRHHHRRRRTHHRKPRRRHNRCKAVEDVSEAAYAKNGGTPTEKACKPCGEAPHPTICRPPMPRGDIICPHQEVCPRPIAGGCRKPVFMPYEEDVQPNNCHVINRLPRCMREGRRERRRHRPNRDECGRCMMPVPECLCRSSPRPCGSCPRPEYDCYDHDALYWARANGYKPEAECGCPQENCGCNPNRVYVLPNVTTMCSIQPTFAPVPTQGCWNAQQVTTVTVDECLAMANMPVPPVTVTLEPNVFCTTQIVCAYYTPLA